MVANLGGSWLQIQQPGAEKVTENMKIKIVRNGREKVRISLQRACGLPKMSQNKNQSLYERHLNCRWP